jgi:hypothetical protein
MMRAGTNGRRLRLSRWVNASESNEVTRIFAVFFAFKGERRAFRGPQARKRDRPLPLGSPKRGAPESSTMASNTDAG